MRRVKMKCSHTHTNADGTTIQFAGAGNIYPVSDEIGQILVNLGVAVWHDKPVPKPVKKIAKPATKKAIGKNKQLKVEKE